MSNAGLSYHSFSDNSCSKAAFIVDNIDFCNDPVASQAAGFSQMNGSPITLDLNDNKDLASREVAKKEEKVGCLTACLGKLASIFCCCFRSKGDEAIHLYELSRAVYALTLKNTLSTEIAFFTARKKAYEKFYTGAYNAASTAYTAACKEKKSGEAADSSDSDTDDAINAAYNAAYQLTKNTCDEIEQYIPLQADSEECMAVIEAIRSAANEVSRLVAFEVNARHTSTVLI